MMALHTKKGLPKQAQLEAGCEAQDFDLPGEPIRVNAATNGSWFLFVKYSTEPMVAELKNL